MPVGAKLLKKGRVEELLNGWAASRRVMVPGPGPDYEDFVPWEGQGFGLPPVNSRRSLKGVFFCRTDKLFSYGRKDGDVVFEEELPEGEVVVFGARPCDARGTAMIDPVFMEDPDLHDPAYKTRRENSTTVVVGCDAPGPACFCTSIGGDPHGKEGADVILTDIGDAYLAEALTGKGEALLKEADLEDAGKEDLDEAARRAEAARGLMEKAFEIDGIKEKLDDLFDHEYWKYMYEKCLGCGVCTYLCPTCHCFDVTDEERGPGYTRFRSWDSCQFALFTLHTSGHNPRPTGMERMRQRFMHKLNYFVHKYGVTACVGCGRCVVNCPVNLDIRQVVREIGGIPR